MKKTTKKRQQTCWMVKGANVGLLFPHTAASTKRESIRRYTSNLTDVMTAYGDDEDVFAQKWKDLHAKGFRCVKVKLIETK